MAWNDVFVAAGGLAGLLGALAILAKLVAEKSADAALKRFDHSLRMMEKEQDARLKRLEEQQRSAAAFASTLDVELRIARNKAYAVLWKETARLPRWPRNAGLSYDDLTELTLALRDWYFESGGIYLSESARVAYGALQEAVHDTARPDRSGTVSVEHYDAVRAACSALRTELTEDLMSRREAPSLGS